MLDPNVCWVLPLKATFLDDDWMTTMDNHDCQIFWWESRCIQVTLQPVPVPVFPEALRWPLASAAGIRGKSLKLPATRWTHHPSDSVPGGLPFIPTWLLPTGSTHGIYHCRHACWLATLSMTKLEETTWGENTKTKERYLTIYDFI